MGRAKIAMEPITNHKKRKLTFNTRKQGLIKKAKELSTLCDVSLSMIIHSEDHQNPETIFFPPDFQKPNGLIDRYKRNRSMEPEKIESYTVFDYFKQRKMKMEDELVKTKKKNLESKYPSWFDFLEWFSPAELRDFAFGLEDKIFEVQSRIKSMKNGYCYPYYTVPIDYNYNNPILQSSNNYGAVSGIMGAGVMPSSNPDSMLNMLMGGGEGDNVVYDGGSLNYYDPLLMEQGFQPELMQFLGSGFGSQGNDLGEDGGEFGFGSQGNDLGEDGGEFCFGSQGNDFGADGGEFGFGSQGNELGADGGEFSSGSQGNDLGADGGEFNHYMS